MDKQRTTRIKDLQKLEARYVKAKRTELDGRLIVWAFWAFVAAMGVMGLINWLAS